MDRKGKKEEKTDRLVKKKEGMNRTIGSMGEKGRIVRKEEEVKEEEKGRECEGEGEQEKDLGGRK